MTRIFSLNALKQGISRLRTKGSADPESLYDLVNAYVTQSGTIQSRPGTDVVATLPPDTKGLCAFNGQLVVFSNKPKTVPSGFSCQVLSNPSNPESKIVFIHFAAPFVGYLYVVPEFDDGTVYHYWLQSAEKWQPNHVYQEGQVVMPTIDNGLAYRAKRLTAPAPPWAPDAARALGDKVEPTKANGYGYTVVEVDGDNPRSGKKEPAWVASEGGLTYEDVDSAPATPPATTPPPGTTLPPGTDDRYGGRSGGRTGTRGEQ